MSLRGKDFRCELDPDMHERLRLMAEFHDLDLATLGSRLLEKAIAGEFHEFTVQDEMKRLSERSRTKCEHCEKMTRISHA